jgi:hypothetical protein
MNLWLDIPAGLTAADLQVKENEDFDRIWDETAIILRRLRS